MGHGVQHIHDALFLGDGGKDDGHVVEGREAAAERFLIIAQRIAVLDEEIPFVHHHHAGFPVALDEVEDAHVLGFHAGGGVNHQHTDIGMLDGTDGTHHRVKLQVFAYLGFLAHAGGIHQHEFVPELVIISGYGIARGARHRGDDVAVFAQQGVGQGRFAHVRLAHDGNVRQVGTIILGGRFLLRKLAHHLVQQVAGAAAVGRRDAPHLAQAQRVELVRIVQFFAGIHFVHHQQDGLARTAQQVGDFGVVIGDARGGLDQEEHQVGLFDGDAHLLADFALEHIVGVGGPSAGVHYREFVTAPFAFAVVAVAGDARRLIDDGLPHAYKAVEQGGFPHIGATHDRYQTHIIVIFRFRRNCSRRRLRLPHRRRLSWTDVSARGWLLPPRACI